MVEVGEGTVGRMVEWSVMMYDTMIRWKGINVSES